MEKQPGLIVTFYSYKGGTGRSLCLANVAARLAHKHDKKVIAIDFDLDAPGLHEYFQISKNTARQKHGLLDYLNDYLDNYATGEDEPNPPLDKYLTKPGKALADQIEWGDVKVMTAGKQRKDFRRRVGDLDWYAIYDHFNGEEALAEFRRQLKEAADLILIDARSGVTDMSSIPLLALADRLFVLFGANRQDMDGTRAILKVVADSRKKKATPIQEGGVLLVPSRIPVQGASRAYSKWNYGGGKQLLEEALSENNAVKADYGKGISTWMLGYNPAYAFGEYDIRLTSRGTEDGMNEKYRALTEYLSNAQSSLATTAIQAQSN